MTAIVLLFCSAQLWAQSSDTLFVIEEEFVYDTLFVYDTIVMFPTATDDNISAEAEGGIEVGVNIEYMTVEECGMDIDSLMEKGSS